jgi:PEP-CTERM motif
MFSTKGNCLPTILVKSKDGYECSIQSRITLMFKSKFIPFTRASLRPCTCIPAIGKTIGLSLIILLGSMAMSFGQVFPAQGGGASATNSFTPVSNFGNLVISYDFYALPDTMDVFFNGANIFSSGPVSGSGEFVIPYGPAPSADFTIVIDQGGALVSETEWNYQVTAAVPEPGSMWLLGLGLPVLAFCRWRRSAAAR